MLINSSLLSLSQAVQLCVQLYVQLLCQPAQIPDHLLQLLLRIAAGNVGRIDFDHGSSLPFSSVLVME
jgi:hypothetical protein